MTRLRTIAVACALLIGVSVTAIAWAAAVPTTDPDEAANTGGSDVKQVTHDADDTTLTYTLETFTDPYTTTPAITKLTWAFDMDADSTVDMCISADVTTQASPTVKSLVGDCSQTTMAGSATDTAIAYSANVFTVTVKRAVLDDIQEAPADDTDADIKYHVTSTDGTNTDDVPDTAAATITQTLPAVAADPSPSPTASASAEPTSSPAATTSSQQLGGTGSADAAEQSGSTVAGTTVGNTGDTTDTANHAWPVWIGFFVIAGAVSVGCVLAYRLVARRDG